MKRICFLSLTLLISNLFSQSLPLGSWRFHPSYSHAGKCEASVNFVYGASERGFFKVHRSNGEMTRLTRLDGFHGTEISSLNFNKDRNVLLIGYVDGYIELLKNEHEIIGIDGFFNKLIQGDKSIIHCHFHDKYAYLSTSLAILEIDLEKAEISNSYNAILPSGSQSVLSTAVKGDSIYAGLPDGILAAPYNNSVNLNDNANWKRVYQGNPCYDLSALGDSLYFYTDSFVFRYHKANVSPFQVGGRSSVVRIKVYDQALRIFRQGNIFSMGVSGTVKNQYVNIISSGTVDSKGDYWFTTSIGGGVIHITPTDFLAFEPNGPAALSVFAMTQKEILCSLQAEVSRILLAMHLM